MTAPTNAESARSIEDHDVEELRRRMHGRLVTPGDASFDDERQVWNGTIDRRPALIARCHDEHDVQIAVRFASEHDMVLSVCGGGHNVAGLAVAEGGMMIDLREMRAVSVDPEAGIARVSGGATLGDVDQATRPHGLAVPVGVATETGIAGLTLGGGLGWLRRKFGLTCDSLVGARVVTATGDVVVADGSEHADLLWALKGGGGNFGIVTEFVFQAHPVADELHFCLVMHPLGAAREALELYRTMAPTAPDDMSGFAVLWSVPDAEEFPAEHRGKDTVVFAAAWAGDPAEGERFFAPLRSVATPYADLSGTMPFLEIQSLFDPDYPKGDRYYWKSTFLADLPQEAVDTLVDFTERRPSSRSSLDVWQLGGAVGRVSREETAYPHRDAPFLLGIEANWGDAADDAANIAWARELFAAMQPYAFDGALYVNFPGEVEEGDQLVRGAYGVNYARLARVKAAYDPGNLFRANLNIPPAG